MWTIKMLSSNYHGIQDFVRMSLRIHILAHFAFHFRYISLDHLFANMPRNYPFAVEC